MDSKRLCHEKVLANKKHAQCAEEYLPDVSPGIGFTFLMILALPLAKIIEHKLIPFG